MKMIKFLDAKGTVLISDALNQIILQKLVTSQNSISSLSRELNIPALKIWRRMQQFMKAKLVEVSGVEKVGNLEKKLYRATALRFDLPRQVFEPKLNNHSIQAAFGTYVKIQNEIMRVWSTFDGKIPKEGDPTDFAINAFLQAFVQVFEKSTIKADMKKMKQTLADFENEFQS